MKKIKFDSKSMTVKLKITGHTVPARNELYIDKYGKVQRLKEDRIQSRRAQARYILKELF